MVFEFGYLRVISPLYPNELRRYVEPMKSSFGVEEIDRLYKMTEQIDDYVDPTTNDLLSCSITSYASNSEESFEPRGLAAKET